MAKELTSLVDSIEGLRLADETTKWTGSASSCPSPTQQALVEAIRTLIQSCEATSAHAQLESLAESTHTPSGQDIAKLSSLRRKVTALARIAETFSDATERYIIAYITSLAGPGTLVRKMLSHFHNKLRSIARDVLNSTSDDSNVLREILEICYNQALHTSGTLHSDDYFIPLGEASLEWPYDPDFESEEYYEHEERLAVDDGYAEVFRVRCERKSEKERQQREEWIRFWVQALNKCPDGPTLFYPPASRLPQCHLADVPRYLFRAFDDGSSGRSDHYIVASMESISATSGRSRVDLFSRTEEEATAMLHGHLTKSCFKGDDADNLMSWSSSLLFVIQYAIWRCHQRGCDPSEIEICMVDTRKFPRGQFARDMSLLRAYREAPGLNESMRKFFDFRLGNAIYDNGEYLSQGVLHHAGRSSMASLAQLIRAGLHNLYHEFADPAAMGLWTNRVRDLRLRWAIERTTTQLEIQTAVEMARACFNRFDASDIALLLLSFKNRKLRALPTIGMFQISKVTIAKRGFSKAQERRRNPNDGGPDEVQRYMTIAETMMPRDRDGWNAIRWFSSTSQLLEEVLECS
ncbi:hypothetical protein CNMCM5793_006580 [Aspergillus hiratsukae]|uniref:DUF7587 domain-containing protein n=1 Tax=Aspergillus hiratsukae TaxID=1194566 RepID=A0A8H6UH07_9EURO|nr:hypothetical protein CNMCM5793_006580 [Aspergillus hiratsukae]KAF7172995.1 hypothetical protein CNMCM6106_007157 [Aspergillus hiratsukae]